ncbi:MAG TPA: DUF4232 domain-containing protein [Mycobacteriales bacterium]|nr:DUF4232 domain-containing protein [Mycobacteriales bacterium]
MRPTSLALVLAALAALSACSADADPDPAPARSLPSASPSPNALPEPVDPLSPMPAVESPAPTGSQPACAAAGLTVTDADLLADEQQLQEVFAIRTTGGPCALRGWPAVTLLGPDGAPLTVTTRQVGRATTLTLSRDSSLSFVLSTPRTQTCQDVSTVAVRLPGTSRTLRAATTMQVCDRALTVSPVQRSQDDEGAEH